ncbi:hypothetical protein [Metallosphaera javensis (ex Sakai et al. 2022)]|uniref:hypothetical protein n=1 Tax=Metallosphaera javensis (ex Sakai et al. 2022) TaxID=2775498 RepID=UPI002585E3A1
MIDYINTPRINKRTFKEFFDLDKEILKVINLRYMDSETKELIERCYDSMLTNEEAEVCKKLDPNLLRAIKENIHLIPQALSLLDLGIQEIFELMLISAYLERAAEDLMRYSYDRTQEDEHYIGDIKEHQREIFNVLDGANQWLEPPI